MTIAMFRSVCLFGFVIALAGCQSAGPNTRAGTALGGLTGSAIGAMAGSHEGKSLEGALVGAATGATLGGLVGSAADEQELRQQQAMDAQQADAVGRAVWIPQVYEMQNHGLSEEVIVNHIYANGVPRRLETADLIALKQSGVDDSIIAAMQAAPVVGETQPRAARNVVVEEHIVVPAPAYGFYPHRCPPRFRRPHRHGGWGVHMQF